jgi:hypothetical protein
VSLESIKEKIATLSDDEQYALMLYLARLRQERDPERARLLAEIAGETDPAKWRTVEEVEARVAKRRSER